MDFIVAFVKTHNEIMILLRVLFFFNFIMFITCLIVFCLNLDGSNKASLMRCRT